LDAKTPWLGPRSQPPAPTEGEHEATLVPDASTLTPTAMEGEEGTGNPQRSVAPLIPGLINMRIRGRFGAELILNTLW